MQTQLIRAAREIVQTVTPEHLRRQMTDSAHSATAICDVTRLFHVRVITRHLPRRRRGLEIRFSLLADAVTLALQRRLSGTVRASLEISARPSGFF